MLWSHCGSAASSVLMEQLVSSSNHWSQKLVFATKNVGILDPVHISAEHKTTSICLMAHAVLYRAICRFVTLYRGGLMISTCLCILAVDFNAFPRRLAKAEAYGGGLMDVGVGGIIIASGLVNTCRHTSHPQHLRQRKAVVAETVGRLAHGLHEALPALVLGVGRLASVKLLGYQEHIGEYGAHWNFFCTIAVVTIIVNTIRVPPRWMGLVALLVSCREPNEYACTLSEHAVASLQPCHSYQQKFCLHLVGLGSWALSSERGTDLLSLNKEGVVSSLGYWALHLSGGALYHMMDATARPLGKMLRKPKGARHGAGALLCWWLFIWTCVDACLWLATIALETLVEPRSRRLCNAAFIAWSTALALASILPLAAAQVVWTLHPIHPSIPIRRPDVVPMPWLPRAANKNMLAVFLVANVLTGIVNMSMDTLGASNVVACATLTGYMVVVAAVAVYLEAQGVADGQKQSE
eukprot:365255-Chlamydomonas_euryale.AAC.13